MLLSTSAFVTWNSRNKKHYTQLGYSFTKMGEAFEANVNDLTPGSQAIVRVRCDYCGTEYELLWVTYVEMKRRTLTKDCCKQCGAIKANEAVVTRYGDYAKMYKKCDEKRRQTNIAKYGTTNPASSKRVKEKIISSNLERYGVPHCQQSPIVREKTKKTCVERYGVENYIEKFKGKFIKECSPCWKGGAVSVGRRDRATFEYIQWRKSVYARDHYTCQACGAHNGDGKAVELNAHHILNWNDNPSARYDVDNGVTLCSDCHTKYHSIFGKRNNTLEQFNSFLGHKSDKKIC